VCAGFDSLGRQPLGDRLLWAEASRWSQGALVQQMRQDVVQLTDVLIDSGCWSSEQH